MAFHWRIRHKLMLGMGQVVGIIGLLLAGTLYGLIAYRTTMKSIDSKLAELRAAENFKVAIGNIKAPGDPSADTPDELPFLREKIQIAQQALYEYEEILKDTIHRNRDPDNGFREHGQIEALRGYFVELDAAVKEAFSAKVNTPDDARVKKALADLLRTAGDLRDAIYQDMAERSKEAREYYKTSLWTVVSISIAGVVLLCGLLRFFYGWVFYPVRDLEQGACRVAQGDFEHRIEVRSGDEMEELAEAFNNMTGRLREMYRDLARQVNERSRQLVRSERLVSVGFLAAGVAHEINNPLASIAFCSEALEQRLTDILDNKNNPAAARPSAATLKISQGDSDREVVAKYLKMIQQEAFRCKEITKRLLEFSRGGERSREPTDLADIVQSVLDMVEHLENCKGKQIVFEPAGKVTAWVNAQEIKSVVLNLVVNALDSMDEGGTLRIALAQREGLASMEFADTGCGMTAEILENIFEPFYTRSRTGKGTGLGLSISHRVISQHGGEIEAVSPGTNQGSTFTVRLPLLPAESVKEESFGHVAA